VRLIVFWNVVPYSLVNLMMGAASTSETSVNFYQTTRPTSEKLIIFIFFTLLSTSHEVSVDKT
jgi:hypothetical protein